MTRTARQSWALAVVAALLPASGAPAHAEPPCGAPAPVCAARSAVFAIAAFDPAGSAVRIGPDLLVTNRHLIADWEGAEVLLPGGRAIRAEVVPSGYPGDLVLLRATSLPPGPTLPPVAAEAAGPLYAVGADPQTREVRVRAPGRRLHAPARGKPLARLHHDAESGPGDSGGALLDADGRLVAIVTSGGGGRNEAIPAASIAQLRAGSGAAGRAVHARIGAAYRNCIERLEAHGSARPGLNDPEARGLIEACSESENRQLLDLAAQVLGRAGRFERSAALLEASLGQDPNASNARLALVVTLQLAREHVVAVPHLERLLDDLPDDPQVLRLAIQAGKLGGAPELAERAYDLLLIHQPETAAAARRFLDADLPPPAGD